MTYQILDDGIVRDATPDEAAEIGARIAAGTIPIVPEEISPRQFRQALTKFGFRQQIESAITASTDQNLKDWYAYTSTFQRHHPEVLAMAQQLGFTSDQLDQVWIYGDTL